MLATDACSNLWRTLTLIVLGVCACSVMAAPPAGEVMFVHGDARIERGDERIPAERGIDFYAGDTFHTEAASTLQLRFTDGGTQAIRPDTTFTLERYERASEEPEDSVKQGELIRGGLRAITGAIGSNAPDNVTYKTPVATMGIRGTSFQLLHYPEENVDRAPEAGTGSYLYVETGLLEMSSDVRGRLVRPGQVFFTAAADRAPELVPDGVEIFEQLDEALPAAEEGNTGPEQTPSSPASEENAQSTSETRVVSAPGGMNQSGTGGNRLPTTREIEDTATEASVTESSQLLRDEAEADLQNARDNESERWIGFEPTTDRSLSNLSYDPGGISPLDLQTTPPDADRQGSFTVNEGDIVWGYWEKGEKITDKKNILDTSAIAVTASDEIKADDIRAELAFELASDMVPLNKRLRFNWADGTALLPTDNQYQPIGIDSDNSFVELARTNIETGLLGIVITLNGESGRQNLNGGIPQAGSGFSIGSVDLNPGNCDESNCIFKSGTFQGRYVGPDAKAIMSLIQATTNGEEATHRGIGVFEKGNIEENTMESPEYPISVTPE